MASVGQQPGGAMSLPPTEADLDAGEGAEPGQVAAHAETGAGARGSRVGELVMQPGFRDVGGAFPPFLAFAEAVWHHDNVRGAMNWL